MKLWIALSGIVALTLPVHASVVLGFIGTESGVPITGQEDIAIYNLTGPTWGCSTPAGTPICTAVTFNNVILTVNGTALNLGDIAPGVTETYTVPGGTFVDGTINTLSFDATITPSILTDDLGNTIDVASSIALSGLPTDGSLAGLTVDLASTVPEPASLTLLLGLCLVLGAALMRGGRSLSRFSK